MGAAGRLVFQPLALVIPFANGTQPPLPRGFRGPHVVLPPIPGDARLALQPVEGEAYSEVSMFDGGVIALRLMQARRLMIIITPRLRRPDFSQLPWYLLEHVPGL